MFAGGLSGSPQELVNDESKCEIRAPTALRRSGNPRPQWAVLLVDKGGQAPLFRRLLFDLVSSAFGVALYGRPGLKLTVPIFF